jgi:ATP-dependent Lon protease
MGKVKDEFFDWAEDNLTNELQIEDALANDDFSINHISNTNKISRSDNNEEINNPTYTIQGLYKKAKDENPIKYEETKCEVCATTVNVNEYNSRHDDAIYSNNKYNLCFVHALEMKTYEIDKFYGKGKSLVKHEQFAKEICELQVIDDDDEQIDILNKYATKLLTPKASKNFTKQDIDNIESLKDEAPNCTDFIEMVALSIFSSIKLDNNFKRKIPPVLLVGNAGIGKTHIVNKVAEVLNIDYSNIPLANIHSSFEFTGLNFKWRNSGIGLYANALLQMKSHTGIINLDEIDKVAIDSQHGSIFEALLQLLEIDTCNSFEDAYLPNLHFKSDDIFFVATANDASRVPKTILSRFKIIKIENPTNQQMKKIIENLYINEVSHWIKVGYIAKPLNKKVLDLLLQLSVRETKNRLRQAVIKNAYSNKSQTNKIIDLDISHFLSDDYFDKILQKTSFNNNLMH